MQDLEREYSPSSRVGGSAAPFISDYQTRSVAARDLLSDHITLVEGGTLLVSAGPGAPLLVFVHGGYWQALSAEESLYLAPALLAHGWSFAAVEYTLAPIAGIDTMIAQCATALAALAATTSASQVVLAGHSAGAQLAAMTSIVQQSPLQIDRTVLVGGVFDLRPLVHTTVNDPLRLDEAAAAALSPALLPVASMHDVVVAWGDNETDAFKSQGLGYAQYLELGGSTVRTIECAGRHHFDIVDDLTDPASELGQLTLGALS